MASSEVAAFLTAVEEGTGAAFEPAWRKALAEAYVAEIGFDLAKAASALEVARAGAKTAPWSALIDLVDVRVALRSADERTIPELGTRALAIADGAGDAAIRARALHTAGVAALRIGDVERAEAALEAALAAVPRGSVAETWILDSFAQALVGVGAWHEARRTIEAVRARKLARGDRLGVAIAAGHRALLELRLARWGEAAEAVREVLDAGGEALPTATRLRLETLALTARVEEKRIDEVARIAAQLAVLHRAPPETHPLKGFAAIALARAATLLGDREGTRRWIEAARAHFSRPEHEALRRVWEAELADARLDDAWWEAQRALFAASGLVGEAEVRSYVLLARRAAARDDSEATRRHLDAAYDRAIAANDASFLALADAASHELDPAAAASRLVARFAGRTEAELARTVQGEATIVFSDLVGFTPRTLELAPDDVMATVRSLFELAVPLLARHRVRPLSCLGDGLLAVAEGDRHEARGLAFATDVVRRAGRVTSIRRALGDAWGLELRAGVASGRVVFGTLGSLFKLEFAAIGPPTNLAARLQGQARPGEVVVAGDTADRAGVRGPEETMALKGWSSAVRALRLRP